jgi:RNA polymerase sigma-70 factor (ECF subfamily)
MPDLACELDSDSTLLRRYASDREEAAFAELVERHGPLVLRVCRRVLRSEQDVEDVFQTSFLLLARKATALSWEGSVGGWLCDAARRLALKTRSGSSRRRSRECLAGTLADLHPRSPAASVSPGEGLEDEIQRRELRRVLHHALRQLPDKYRVPVELCYLEGKTNAEAARQLGWPAGSMSRRLQRARSMLRQRLVRYGLVSFVLVAAAIVAFRMPTSGRPDLSARPFVRHAMRSLRHPPHGQADWPAALAAAFRGEERASDRDLIATLGQDVHRLALEIADHDPGGDRVRWEYHVASMERAAIDLSTAARQADRLVLLAAVRRLDSACINCHEVYEVRADDSSAGGLRMPDSLPQF